MAALSSASAPATPVPQSLADKAKVAGCNALLKTYVSVTSGFDSVLADMRVRRLCARIVSTVESTRGVRCAGLSTNDTHV